MWLILYKAKRHHKYDHVKDPEMRWGDYPGLPRRVQCNHKGYKRSQSEKGDVILQVGVGVMLFEGIGR